MLMSNMLVVSLQCNVVINTLHTGSLQSGGEISVEFKEPAHLIRVMSVPSDFALLSEKCHQVRTCEQVMHIRSV